MSNDAGFPPQGPDESDDEFINRLTAFWNRDDVPTEVKLAATFGVPVEAQERLTEKLKSKPE